ncbi:thiosulfate oxidation carrier complex protein SoxZ [Methylomonas sp. LW13]|uniref:Thiosulfate oxidation carrier complex protein SoxZ n=1 Tax=Methylomonas defluvii TaxID=3045149 RepID=A0ABU4UJV7_9GAMM|nr:MULTISPECIES: thiosulfate oxidation carrier complex protein SoxZ [unclassified Methylomonas]MDX8129162.1 thiosulfate oxidation carrier complex protein SoxZ [Methylomonas sp. OY6]QBC27189.1 thiosulfate oxidation carrier complex protein SoxZ [Methylomonas sp. LW13]
MTNSIKIRSQRRDGYTEVKLLITHPMENGRNRDANGELIPAHFIERLLVKLNDQLILTTNMAGSLSKNPFFTFRLKAGNSGDRLSAEWTDNRQNQDHAEHVLD